MEQLTEDHDELEVKPSKGPSGKSDQELLGALLEDEQNNVNSSPTNNSDTAYQHDSLKISKNRKRKIKKLQKRIASEVGKEVCIDDSSNSEQVVEERLNENVDRLVDVFRCSTVSELTSDDKDRILFYHCSDDANSCEDEPCVMRCQASLTRDNLNTSVSCSKSDSEADEDSEVDDSTSKSSDEDDVWKESSELGSTSSDLNEDLLEEKVEQVDEKDTLDMGEDEKDPYSSVFELLFNEVNHASSVQGDCVPKHVEGTYPLWTIFQNECENVGKSDDVSELSERFDRESCDTTEAFSGDEKSNDLLESVELDVRANHRSCSDTESVRKDVDDSSKQSELFTTNNDLNEDTSVGKTEKTVCAVLSKTVEDSCKQDNLTVNSLPINSFQDLKLQVVDPRTPHVLTRLSAVLDSDWISSRSPTHRINVMPSANNVASTLMNALENTVKRNLDDKKPLKSPVRSQQKKAKSSSNVRNKDLKSQKVQLSSPSATALKVVESSSKSSKSRKKNTAKQTKDKELMCAANFELSSSTALLESTVKRERPINLTPEAKFKKSGSSGTSVKDERRALKNRGSSGRRTSTPSYAPPVGAIPVKSLPSTSGINVKPSSHLMNDLRPPCSNQQVPKYNSVSPSQIGKIVTLSMIDMTPEQQYFAQNIISAVLREGKSGSLCQFTQLTGLSSPHNANKQQLGTNNSFKTENPMIPTTNGCLDFASIVRKNPRGTNNRDVKSSSVCEGVTYVPQVLKSHRRRKVKRQSQIKTNSSKTNKTCAKK